MRRSIRVERRLGAPPEAVFEMVSDHARYDRFDGVRRSELVVAGDPHPNGLGAVRWVWLGPFRFEEEMTAYEPPWRLDYLIRDVRGLPFRHEGGSIRLERDGTGTQAVWTSSFEIPIPVVGGAMDGIFKGRLERGFAHVLERSAELSTAGRGRLEVLKEVLEAFNRHDLDAIMSHFADDCVFESPRGPDAWGRRFVGKDAVREGLAARFEGVPDVRYAGDDHFACGRRGVSEWTISGTSVEGERIEVRGCDLWTFGEDGRLTRKDSFWKIREP